MLDGAGLGAPVWWLCGKSLAGLIALAHFVSSRPGAVTMLPSMPVFAFGLVVLGGLWICLWRERWRYLGLIPAFIGALMIVANRAPDIYITGDGRHVGIRNDHRELAMLRTRSGDFIRDMILENAGVDGQSQALEDWPNANCNADACLVSLTGNGRKWVLLATRSARYISALELSAACRRADIVVSERRLPASCQPRWIKADRDLLSRVGGMTIDLEKEEISTAIAWTGRHEWTRYRSGDAGARNADVKKTD